MTKLELNINQALYFLDTLDPAARHTIASEHPTARNGLPKWEGGATYELSQRKYMIEDIQERQRRGSNVYYSVNRPCTVSKRQGFYGKNNIDDIIAIRALAFDIDTLQPQNKILEMINKNLDGELKPSVIIFTGGGYHLIYLLNQFINIELYRPPKNDKEKEENDIFIYNRSSITTLAKDFEFLLRAKFPELKIDNMSNVDRVMRLPGTINYPKQEKLAKGQKEELSRILIENHHKIDIYQLRDQVPRLSEAQQQTQERRPFIPSSKSKWTGYLKAKACCEFIRDKRLADNNEIYTLNVMLPLIGAIHDSNEYNNITLEEAEELFMLAISGGERYNTMGRGPGYFMRQWKSHRPELTRNGTKSLGGLIHFCKENGMQLPWVNTVVWEQDFERQLKELSNISTSISDDLFRELDQFSQK